MMTIPTFLCRGLISQGCCCRWTKKAVCRRRRNCCESWFLLCKSSLVPSIPSPKKQQVTWSSFLRTRAGMPRDGGSTYLRYRRKQTALWRLLSSSAWRRSFLGKNGKALKKRQSGCEILWGNNKNVMAKFWKRPALLSPLPIETVLHGQDYQIDHWMHQPHLLRVLQANHHPIPCPRSHVSGPVSQVLMQQVLTAQLGWKLLWRRSAWKFRNERSNQRFDFPFFSCSLYIRF